MSTFTAIRQLLKADLPNTEIVTGFFPFSTVNVDSTHDWTLTAGDVITFTSDTDGVAGDSLYVRALADGSAKASYAFTTTHYTSELEAHTGGTAGNAFKVSLIPHAVLGGGVFIWEDSSNVIIHFEDGVSTGADVDTALAGCTLLDVKTAGGGAVALAAADDTVFEESLSGGTAATYVAWGTSNPHLTIHFTNGVSTVTAIKTAVNTSATNKSMTASSSGAAHTAVTGDAFLATALAGGVDAEVLDTTLVVGKGFTPTRSGVSGTGEYTITFNESYKAILCKKASIQQHSATAYDVQWGDWDKSAKTLKIRAIDGSGAVDPAPNTNSGIFFYCVMQK